MNIQLPITHTNTCISKRSLATCDLNQFGFFSNIACNSQHLITHSLLLKPTSPHLHSPCCSLCLNHPAVPSVSTVLQILRVSTVLQILRVSTVLQILCVFASLRETTCVFAPLRETNLCVKKPVIKYLPPLHYTPYICTGRKAQNKKPFPSA